MLRATVALLIACWLVSWPLQPVAGESQAPVSDKSPSQALSADVPVDYLRDIRPILSDSCYACHGPDRASRQAGLRLDRWEAASSQLASGHVAIVPGSTETSELVRRISSDDPDEVMPPSDLGKALTEDQIGLVRRWIEQGAPWKQHWAFVPPQRPEVPGVRDQDWPRGDIDFFIQSRLDQQGWRPSPEADKQHLIRRVTFDLIGLPPTLAEIDAFVADESPDAYERVVDRLLQSPHYGEHMARFWLDAARYGDTHGLHLDNYREMWPYRDWVIRAFNDNLPYDQFAIEQLGGDLLPDVTLDQQIATGFCRAHVTTNEGGSIEEEVYVRNVVDRVSTTGTVFMGLTLGCAACHDHKFDPFTQQEFYQLFAFFNNLDGPALDGNVKNPAPVLSVPSQQQAAALEDLQANIAETRGRRDARRSAADPDFSTWLDERLRLAQRREADAELHLADHLVVHCDCEEQHGPQLINRAVPDNPGRIIGNVERVEGRVARGLEFGNAGYVDLGQVGDFDDFQPFSYGAWVRTVNGRFHVILAKTDPEKLYKGYELTLLNGRVTTQISRREPGYMIKVVTKNPVIENERWHHVFVTYDGSKRASGVVIYVDGQTQPVDVWSDALHFKGGIRNSQPLVLGRRDAKSGFAGGRVDDVRLYDRSLTDAEVQAVFLESSLAWPDSTSPAGWTDEQRSALRHFYLLHHDAPFARYTGELDGLLSDLRREVLAVPTTLVFREREDPRDAFVLIRGQYDQRGEQVERAVPAALPPMDEALPRNRLGLARWLVAAENPLTSRVAVNRFWQQVFGTGLVETSEDFGNQGALPSHPELLDWLAVEFRDGGWNVKALMKSIVMSATYRQSSHITPTLAREDPHNRLLARGPRFRLDAEMLRDQALFVSGLLVTKLGGPSVKPPQPAGLWKAVGYSGSNTVEFVADTEPEQIHRRSLYTFLKRTALPPQMSTLDAPSRESTCVRRERTNTPLQALLLLNDPQYVEAARALAARVLHAEYTTPATGAALMYRLCTARRPSKATVEELVRLYEQQLAKYRHDEAAARKLLALQGEQSGDWQLEARRLAAWTIVANLILNLDEVVMKN